MHQQRPEDRPRYVLENHEDEVYHDIDLRERATEPEYWAFVNRSWVFNRAMRWIDAPGGTLICCSEGGDLWLTGGDAVSEWFSDSANEIMGEEGGYTRFVQRTQRRRDCVVLPAFQFNVEQHPAVRLEVLGATTDWQFCVMIKGRSGPPLLASPWQPGPAAMTFDLHQALREHGFNLHFVELHFVVGMWAPEAGEGNAVRFSLRLCAAPAIVPCLPVIRTLRSAEADGVPISAVTLDQTGERLDADRVFLIAQVGDRSIQLQEQDGIWSGRLWSLPAGDHLVRLVAGGTVDAHTDLTVRITDGRFLSYDPGLHSLARDGVPTGPLSGSYHGLVHISNAGEPGEAIVQGQAAFDAWDRSQPPGEHWHYWEALTEEELRTRFQFLRENGWNLLHICQHWGLWEKLDAGGRIAPHGAEQAALYYRLAAQHGLAVVQALSHYPYGRTPPYRQYLEAGYQNDHWTDVEAPFTERFHGYLNDYISLFRHETGIAFLTTSGEGDCQAGCDRVNDTCRFVTARDPQHLFLSEPIHKLDHLLQAYYAGWEQPLFGARLYWIGSAFEPELDIGIEFRLYQLGPVFMAEGSWPCPHLYATFTGRPLTWAGTPEYRTRVRDSMCLGLVHRIPVLLTWEEQLTEDEHRLVDVIRRQVDWAQPFVEAPVAIRVGDENVREKRQVLRDYEAAFSAWPLATRYLLPDAPVPSSAQVVIDARKPFCTPALASEGGAIPDAVRRFMPLRIADGFRASYAWSRDRRTLLAYVYNCTGHLECDYASSFGLGGRYHRLPRPAPLQVTLQNLPNARLKARVYDLQAKTLIYEGLFSEGLSLDLGKTDADVFVLVTPG